MLNRKEFEKLEVYEHTPKESNAAKKIIKYVEEKYDVKVYKCVFDYKIFEYLAGKTNCMAMFVKIVLETLADYKKVRTNPDTGMWIFDFPEDHAFIKEVLSKDNMFQDREFFGPIYDSFQNEALEYCYAVSADDFKHIRDEIFNPATMLHIDSRFMNIVYKDRKCLDDAIKSGETERLKKAYYDFIKPYDKYNFITMDMYLLAIFECPDMLPTNEPDCSNRYHDWLRDEKLYLAAVNGTYKTLLKEQRKAFIREQSIKNYGEKFKKLEAYEHTPKESNAAKEIIKYVEEKYDVKVYKCVFRYDGNLDFEGDRDGTVTFVTIFLKTTADYNRIRLNRATGIVTWDFPEDEAMVKEILSRENMPKCGKKCTVLYDSFQIEALKHCYSISAADFLDIKDKIFNPETMLSVDNWYMNIVYKDRKCLDDAIKSGETERLKKVYYDFIKPYDKYNFITMDMYLLAIFECPDMLPTNARERSGRYYGWLSNEEYYRETVNRTKF